MSSNILLIDESDHGRSHTIGAFKKVNLIEQNRDARDGTGGVQIPLRGDHIHLGNATDGRYKIPAGDDFPVRIERHQLKRSRGRAPNLESSEYSDSDHLPNPFDIGDPMASEKVRLKIKALRDELKRSERLFEAFPDANPLNSPYKRQKPTKIPISELYMTNGNDQPTHFEINDIGNLIKVNDICAPSNSDTVLVTVADGIRSKRSYDLAAGNWVEDFGNVNIYV
jgi:hypothetical protein